MIAPVNLDKWKGFKATRVFRGVRYAIAVKRQGKGNEVALTVDGKAVDGAIVQLPAAGTKEVKVEVRLE
jgi:cellobiose phosphorylase